MFACRGSRFVAAGLAATRVQCREGGYGMGAHLFTKRLATGLVLALSSVFAAQTVSAVSEGSLRPSWSDSAMAEGWRAVCGDVRNVGQVPAGSRAVFCVPMPAGATSYNVTVLRADWGFVEAP